jgi:hypothetical protein
MSGNDPYKQHNQQHLIAQTNVKDQSMSQEDVIINAGLKQKQSFLNVYVDGIDKIVVTKHFDPSIEL